MWLTKILTHKIPFQLKLCRLNKQALPHHVPALSVKECEVIKNVPHVFLPTFNPSLVPWRCLALYLKLPLLWLSRFNTFTTDRWVAWETVSLKSRLYRVVSAWSRALWLTHTYEIFHWVIPLCSTGDVTPRSSPHHPPTSLPSAPPAPTLWIWLCNFSSTKYNLCGFKMLGKGSQKDVHAVSSKVWRQAKSVKCLWVSRLQCSVFKEFIRTFTSHFVFRGSVWMRDSVLRFKVLFLMFKWTLIKSLSHGNCPGRSSCGDTGWGQELSE